MIKCNTVKNDTDAAYKEAFKLWAFYRMAKHDGMIFLNDEQALLCAEICANRIAYDDGFFKECVLKHLNNKLK